MNRYHLGAVSGLVTGVTANGVVFAFRNSSAAKTLFITGARLNWWTTTAFGGAQEMRLSVLPVTSFASANYTGGTDLSNYTGGSAVLATNAIRPRAKNRGDQRLELRSVLETGNVRIASTGALSHAGAPTIATHPWLDRGASSATTHAFEATWEAPGLESGAGFVDYEGAWQIRPEEGFVVTMPIAMGASGVGRLAVELDWLES